MDEKELYEIINKSFEYGKEFIFKWSDYEKKNILYALENISNYLQELPLSLSYEGTDKQVVWRKSCWVSSSGLNKPFFETYDEIRKFDGDLKDGLEGLKALDNENLRLSLYFLKKIIDDSLIKTAKAVGIPDELIELCTIRYRIIKYTENKENPGGIGLHPDGNLLSSLITDSPGLNVFDFDGKQRKPLYCGTILMCGSILYRWSDGIYLPTFHNVKALDNKQKTSIVGFLNFPDKIEIIKKNNNDIFYHDINKIKNDDKSQYGELSQLWSKILKIHNIIIPKE
jgi:hypothetical protein